MKFTKMNFTENTDILKNFPTKATVSEVFRTKLIEIISDNVIARKVNLGTVFKLCNKNYPEYSFCSKLKLMCNVIHFKFSKFNFL